MTPPTGGGTSRPHADALEAYFAALAQGHASAAVPDTPTDGSADLRKDWRGMAECVRLLAETWPQRTETTDPEAAGGDPNAVVCIGPFELVRPLGRGGFGLVFLARDPRLDRLVAVKVPRPDVALTANLYRRFVREGRAVAGLDHPNILSLYETGESGLTPYIAGAYCPGPTLAVWLQRQTGPVPPRVAADLVMQLANAVQHAHDRGVLHRDLKPGNVMLQPHDGAPTEDPPPGSFTPRLTDFGLARLVDDIADETRSVAYIGTPSYMAPEQARGQSSQVGPAADVYGLGAILYQVLTGRPPFRGATDADTLRQVVADEPIPPRRERGDVPADLEAVCLKCLEKDAASRYGSAAELATDLRRFLDGHPTAARPFGPLGRALRWARRRPDLAALSALTAATVIAAMIVGVWFSARLATSRADHAASERVAATQEFFAVFERVRQRRAEPRAGWAQANLADLQRVAGLTPAAERLVDLRSEAAAALAAPELRRVRSLSQDFEVYAVAFSPDGRALALGGWGTADGVGRVRLVDPTDGRTLRDLTFPDDTAAAARFGKTDGCRNLVFSPDGRWLVAASRFAGLHRWDLGRAEPTAVSWGSPSDKDFDLAFGTVRPVLFTFARGETIAWDAAGDWSEIGRWTDPQLGRPTVDPVAGRVAFTTVGKLDLLDGRTLQPFRPPAPKDGPWQGLFFGPDGRTLAGTMGTNLRLAEADTGRALRTLVMPGSDWAETSSFTAVEFHPDGALLATSSEWSRHVKLWDVIGGQLAADVVAGDRGSMRLAVHPGGRTLIVAADGRADVYEIGGLAVRTPAAVQPFPVWFAQVTPDGRSLATVAHPDSYDDAVDVELSLWLAQGAGPFRPQVRKHHRNAKRRLIVAVHPDGQGLAHTTEKVVMFRSAGGPPQRVTDGQPSDVRFGPDGRLWMAMDYAVRAFAPTDWQQAASWVSDPNVIPPGNVYYTVSPGQNWVLAGRRDGRVFLLDAEAHRLADWPVGESPIPRDGRATAWEPVTALHLNEHAGLAVVGTEKGRVRVFRVPSGDVLAHLPEAHHDGVDAAALSPDGNLVATGGRDRAIRLWRPDGTPILTLRATAAVTMLAFTPDGKDLITLAAGERGLRRWHLDRLDAELRALGLDAAGP